MKLISSSRNRLLGVAAFVLSGALTALGATDFDDDFRWRILPHISNNPDSKVNLTLSRHSSFNTEVTTTSVPLSSLHGLEPGDFWGGPVSFHIRRDSGTLHCKGSFVMGIGSGSVRFEPDPYFISELKALGISMKEDQLASLAFEDLRLSTVRDLREACPCVRSLDDVRDLSHHGVDGRYLRQVAQLSSGPLDIQEITSMKDHGVQTSLLEALKYSGYQLSAESVTELQDHGVDASFVRALAPQFRSDRTARSLIALHDHGVSPEFARSLRDAGAILPAEEIIQLHDHGIDAQMVRTAKDAGLDATPNSVIRLHDHGVEPQFVRSMETVRHSKLTVDDLVELHDHGVSPEFAQQISASGFPVSDPRQLIQLHEHGVPADLAAELARSHRSSSSVNDLIRLHDHGVDAAFLRSFDTAGYSSASVDELIELHDHGVTADYARHLQAEGFGVLPVAKLIQMKDHGV
jgi:hypothetical protein